MAINLKGVPYEFSEKGRQGLKILLDAGIKVPEKFNHLTVESFATMTGEDAAAMIPAFIENDLALGQMVCDTGRAVCEIARETQRINSMASLGVLVGLSAIGICGYLYYKIKTQDDKIRELQDTIRHHGWDLG